MATTACVEWYAVLGVDCGAALPEIRRHYIQIALETHPDKNGHLGDAERTRKEELFKLAGHAYEVLSDAAARATLDAERQAHAAAVAAAGADTDAAAAAVAARVPPFSMSDAIGVFIRCICAVYSEHAAAAAGGVQIWASQAGWIAAVVIGGAGGDAALRSARICRLGFLMGLLVENPRVLATVLRNCTDEERQDLRRAFLLLGEAAETRDDASWRRRA